MVLGGLAVAGIALGNLRGVRESGRLFAAPTYFFIVSIIGMVGWGLAAATFGWLPATPYEPHRPGAPPSPVSRPSPTACPRSGRRRDGMPSTS